PWTERFAPARRAPRPQPPRPPSPYRLGAVRSLLVALVDDLGVHDVVSGLAARGALAGRPRTGRARAGRAGTGLLGTGGRGLRVAHHPLDVILRQRRAAGDGHRLLLAGAQVLGVDVDDAIGVDVEGDLDLRYPARRRRQAGQLEGTQLLVVRRDLPLALEHLD